MSSIFLYYIYMMQHFVLEAPCRVGAGTYIKRAMSLWVTRRWWWIAMPLLSCVALMVVNVKWSVIAIIIVLALLMMLLSLVYFNFVFSPYARWSVMEKTVEVDVNGIHFAFVHPKMKKHELEWDSIRSIQFRDDSTVLRLKESPVAFVLLPVLDYEQSGILKSLYLAW